MIPPPIFEFRRIPGLTWRSVLFLIVAVIFIAWLSVVERFGQEPLEPEMERRERL